MKKRNMILTFLLLAVVLTTFKVNSTYAAYVTNVKGEDTATVAKFAFKFNSVESASSSDVNKTINLFTDSYLSGNVLGDSSEKVVAPGTSGYAEISIENTGEVAIDPIWTITEVNASSIPLVYAVTTSTATPTEWELAASLSVTPATINVDSSVQTYYLHWKWETATNAADTTLGVAGTATVKVNVNIQVKQHIS